MCGCDQSSGADPGFRKGGAQLCYCEHGNNLLCVKYTIWHAKHAKPRESGGMPPPENFEN